MEEGEQPLKTSANELMNQKPVCRTDLATPGLLNIFLETQQSSTHNVSGSSSYPFFISFSVLSTCLPYRSVHISFQIYKYNTENFFVFKLVLGFKLLYLLLTDPV